MGFDKEKIAELYPGAENMMFSPMKYYAASDEKIDRACETNDWFGEKKIDGALYLATLTEKGDYLFSRTPSKKTGLLVDKSENVPHIMNALSVLPKGTILLGEIYYPNGTSKNVTSIMGCLPEKAKESIISINEKIAKHLIVFLLKQPMEEYFSLCFILKYII